VLHAPVAGVVENLRRIGELVRAGEPVLALAGADGRVPLTAGVDGILRGLIRPGYQAHAGMKVADVDPRGRREHCFTISDKALAVAGGVLEAILMLGVRR
jgi:xanthine dehydrogenase accessory factor